MIRNLITASMLGFFLVVASMGWLVFLAYSVPAHAGETCGLASWYGTESGTVTASGEAFDGTSLTAASRALPFGTKLRITYRDRSVTVRINDRGPYVKGRFLDISKAAAERIGMIGAGVARVCAEKLP